MWSDPRDLNSFPLDSDGDGLCDAKETASSTIDDSDEEDGDVAFFISSRYWWCCILLLCFVILIDSIIGYKSKGCTIDEEGP